MAEFKLPTETIELPSKGLLYASDNPLSSGTIEMKYMTAKEEDILTNQNYIKNGTVIDKLLQSLIVTEDGKWFVEKILHGRWDIRTTAVNILMAIRDYKPLSIGIEKGALKNAVLPYLSDLMRKSNIYAHIIDLTHGNRKKADRIIWALQGRFEHGRITLNSEENWDDFVDQLLMFPAQGVHDDLPDALSYIDQLAVTSYFQEDEEDEWQPLDIISGC